MNWIMNDLSFIRETSNLHKVKSLVVTLAIVIALLVLAILFSTIWYGVWQSIPGTQLLPNFGIEEIKNIDLSGLFYAELVGGIFFIPTPDEIIFYYALIKGNSIFLCIFYSVTAFMIAQVFNYWVGLKLSGPILHLVSKRQLYAARRFSNKHGVLGVFMTNFLPLPAPLLTFGLAITNYNFTRLMIWTFLGKVAKYTVIAGFFLATTYL